MLGAFLLQEGLDEVDDASFAKFDTKLLLIRVLVRKHLSHFLIAVFRTVPHEVSEVIAMYVNEAHALSGCRTCLRGLALLCYDLISFCFLFSVFKTLLFCWYIQTYGLTSLTLAEAQTILLGWRLPIFNVLLGLLLLSNCILLTASPLYRSIWLISFLLAATVCECTEHVVIVDVVVKLI